MARHKKSDDLVDYLASQTFGPLIISGQVIQEFWNNQLSAIETVSSGLSSKFNSLKKEFSVAGNGFEPYANKIVDILGEYEDQYGHVYDGSVINNMISVAKLLKTRGVVSYVPRSRFDKIAINRKRTKTPPGFMDDGDGDFYVWTELLYGLLKEKRKCRTFDSVVLLTNDSKKDWSRGGIPHPVLAAEVNTLFGVDFKVVTIEELEKLI